MKIPFWMRCFLLCVVSVVIFGVSLSATTYFRIYNDKSYIIQRNAKSVSSYVDTIVTEKLYGLEDWFCGVNTANSMYGITDVEDIQKQLTSLCLDVGEVLGLYYIDNAGRKYVIGDVGGRYESREGLIEIAKDSDAYKEKRRVWFYARTDRGNNACVLYSDLVYVGDDYSKSVIGQLLLFIDADRINKLYIDNAEEEEEEGIAIIDNAGNIVFSTKGEWCGLNIFNHFEQAGTKFSDNRDSTYIRNNHKSKIDGWTNVVYFNAAVISKQTQSLFFLIFIVAIICVLVLMLVAYCFSTRIGRPIDDIFRYIKISSEGKVILPVGEGEEKEIRSILDAMFTKIEKQMNDNYLMQIEMKNLKIKAYESQINPHFIFNTLQIIQMLSVLGRTQEVSEVVTELGEMMHYSLGNDSMVKLREEISIVESYFKILKYRYQENFVYRIVVDEELYDCSVLKFAIQPFVENSIRHGLADKKGLWEIFVLVKKMNDEVVIVVRDNGKGFSKEKLVEIKEQLSKVINHQQGVGIGIYNVNNRIKLLFGEEYGVDIFDGDTTQVVIHIPYINYEEGDFGV